MHLLLRVVTLSLVSKQQELFILALLFYLHLYLSSSFIFITQPLFPLPGL